MIRGLRMESPSGFGQVGIRILDCSLTALESRLASALEWAILADLAGAGTTGDRTGITTMSFTTTTLTYPTAESSLITTPSIASARTSIMEADFMVEADFRAEERAGVRVSMGQPRSMDSCRLMPSLAVIPARSVVSIMEELRGDSLFAGSRVSVAFTAAEATAAEVAGNPVHS